MRLNNKEFTRLVQEEGFTPKVIDLTEEIYQAKQSCCMTECYEDYIDFKQISLDYDIAVVSGVRYFIRKFGLGEEVQL